MTGLYYWWRRAFLRMLLWGVNGDLAAMETQAARIAIDRIEWTRRRSDILIELINLES